MRDKSQFHNIINFVDSTYNRLGNSLMLKKEKYNPEEPGHYLGFGYCYKYTSDDKLSNVYNVYQAEIGIPDTDLRVLVHEYGHIYFGHLDEVYSSLDSRLNRFIEMNREELVRVINNSCKIDFADKLLDRVIDDQHLNHSLHNVAMDMEINSKILDLEEVQALEKDISSIMPEIKRKIKIAESMRGVEGVDDKSIDDLIDVIRNKTVVKFIHPSRYYLDKENKIPFPNELTYPEYLVLLIKNLDQFVKMIVSVINGGNGDTSTVSDQDVKDALDQMAGSGGNSSDSNSSNGGEDDSNQEGGGSSSGMNAFDKLLEKAGQKPSSKGDKDNKGEKGNSDNGSSNNSNGGEEKGEKESPYKGIRGSSNDHNSENRTEADKARQSGQLRKSGGVGCGSTGSATEVIEIDKNLDSVEIALREVMKDHKAKVINFSHRKDLFRKYNRGINRSVISPSIIHKVSINEDPKLVFLIDVSGSMDRSLVQRVILSISKELKKLNRGLRYDIIAWSTALVSHIKDIDPSKSIPKISIGGGTRMAEGIKFFKENYKDDSILVLISDFEDHLEEWAAVERNMPTYSMYGFDYGDSRYSTDGRFKYFKVRRMSNK